MNNQKISYDNDLNKLANNTSDKLNLYELNKPCNYQNNNEFDDLNLMCSLHKNEPI